MDHSTIAHPAVLNCASCSMHRFCLPQGLSADELGKMNVIVQQRRRVGKGQLLFRAGDRFSHVYAVRLGHTKTFHINPAGAEQITAFNMAGELLALNAIATQSHHYSAAALEDCEICEISFADFERLMLDIPPLLRHFHRVLSQQITREQSTMLLLGNMAAPQRFAAFLVGLASRYKARGLSQNLLVLRMSREDIGNHLGLTIESISRLISRFKKESILSVDHRELRVLDPQKLQAIAAGDALT